MFNFLISNGRSRRGICQSVQDSLLVLALVFGCCAWDIPQQPIVPSLPQISDPSKLTEVDNARTVVIASEAINAKLYRAIAVINMRDGDRINEHYFLFVKSLMGFRYLYSIEGSNSLEPTFIDANNTVNYQLFGEASYPNEVFDSVCVTPCPQEKNKSDTILKNACLLQAINFQADLLDSYGEKLAWHSILHVYYKRDDKQYGHAYCAFRLKNMSLPVEERDYIRNQTFLVFDFTGTHKINLNKYDAESVGKYLKGEIISANYDE